MLGFAPLLHTRISGLAAALKEGGSRGAIGSARHHVRRGLVMAEVALAVMLVVGAGLLLRTVYNLSAVDSGFDRSRLVTFAVTVPTANYPQASARLQLFQRLVDKLRAVLPACRPHRPCRACRQTGKFNADGTEIDNYTAPPPRVRTENISPTART